jgi:hypothetical protein
LPFSLRIDLELSVAFLCSYRRQTVDQSTLWRA